MLGKLITEGTVWIEALVGCLPGNTGGALRRSWYSRRFRSCGSVNIGQACEFISPDSISFHGHASIGRNCFFTADGGSIEIGDQTAFNVNVHLNASIGGKVRIGENCLIGPNVVMRTANHRFQDITRPIRLQGHAIGDIIIEDDVWIGANVTIVGNVKIQHGAVIGAGTVVTKDVPPMAIVVGFAARTVRFRGAEGSDGE